MSSVSPILVNVSSSICLRMTAGSTNRSACGTGMRSTASAARLAPAARIGCTVTTASADRPSRVSTVSIAVPSRSARIASSRPPIAAGPVRRPGRQVAELGAEQLVGLAREDARCGAVVLDDPPVVIDAENEGAH